MEAYIDGKRIRFDARSLIGQGGEAEVFDLGDGRVLKRFKSPGHTDFVGSPDAQQAATLRIEEHKQKLPALMRLTLPQQIVTPLSLASDRAGLIGYVMPKIDGAVTLLDHAQPSIRRGTGGGERNLAVLRSLYRAVAALHAASVVIGDFNDSNVLARGDAVYCIDADSYQFDRFVCRVFSDRFVDPRLCAQAAGIGMTLVRPHDRDSDWYAFSVMVMQLLLLAGPYAGVYRPKTTAARLPPSLRPLERITVFHPDVQYPKPALPLQTLPDHLLGFLEETYVRDRRVPFPLQLLDAVRFTRCSQCGGEHARAVCPFCTHSPRVLHRTTIRGRVQVRSLLRTEGTLLTVAANGDDIYWLAHEQGAFVREGNNRVLTGALDPAMRFGLVPRATLLSHSGKLAVISAGAAPEMRPIAKHAFATHAGRAVYVGREGVWRLGDSSEPLTGGDTQLGTVLENDAHVWLGPRFGLGLYRAGELAVGYVFSPDRKGLIDSLRPSCIRGRVLELGCVLGDYAWLCVAREEAGKRIDTCLMIDSTGHILASVEGDARDLPWLASASFGAAIGKTLLVPTDAGLVRVEADQGSLSVTRVFSDTEPFVDAASKLLPTCKALLVHDAHELRALTMEVTV